MMKDNTIALLRIQFNILYKSTVEYDFEHYKEEETLGLNKIHGTGNWLITPTSDLPTDFSIDNYTIENGQLVKASPEVIAERQRFKLLAQRESIRAERQRRYDGQEITSLYWNWVESSDEADKAKWIAAKNQVRQELPYPEN